MTELSYRFVSFPEEDDVLAELLADDIVFAHVVRRDAKTVVAVDPSEGVTLEIDVDELIDLLQSARESLR